MSVGRTKLNFRKKAKQWRENYIRTTYASIIRREAEWEWSSEGKRERWYLSGTRARVCLWSFRVFDWFRDLAGPRRVFAIPLGPKISSWSSRIEPGRVRGRRLIPKDRTHTHAHIHTHTSTRPLQLITPIWPVYADRFPIEPENIY